jgi:amino acid transporter
MTEHVKKFGTAPVFFTAISTILGAILFLRFGYAVGNVGLFGALLIVLLGHAVTIPTAMSIAEIATNQKVEGGGEYFIISRSFGLVMGSSIGIALYFSQAISVAFYIIAFAEAFNGLFDFLQGLELHPVLMWLFSKKQLISIPALGLLMIIVLTKGADLGVKALYIVVATLTFSLIAFFAGGTEYGATTDISFFDGANEISFFTVFAIIFPAFTGMTAGVGLSGDLKEPGKSLPMGTLAGTLLGMVVYVFICFKLAMSATTEELLDTNTLVMTKIAWQGWWVIPLGLAAATISSALGSIMVAPRTLQAIGQDRLIPSKLFNNWVSKGRGKSQEPFNATVLTIIIAFVFVMIGGVDFVAKIISMFFMVTYGTLNLISFLQHFSADPSYRPTFKSRWYFSLFGAIGSYGLMFFMNPGYAFLAVFTMVAIYIFIARLNPDKQNLSVIFQGVIFQVSRSLQVFLQKANKEQSKSWRPSVVCVSESSFERLSAFELLKWISHRYGFGTYIHKVPGYLSRSTNETAQQAMDRLIKMAEDAKSNIYVDSLISPSFTSAIAQVIQLPGISGTENNLLLLEYSKSKPDLLEDIVDNFSLINAVNFDIALLATNERGFGLYRQIHIWITDRDYNNGVLNILLAYVLLGHPDWKRATIKIFAVFPEASLDQDKTKLFDLIQGGKLPISKNNINIISRADTTSVKSIINQKSKDADLTMIGFRYEAIKHKGSQLLSGYDEIGNTLFVHAGEEKIIK